MGESAAQTTDSRPCIPVNVKQLRWIDVV